MKPVGMSVVKATLSFLRTILSADLSSLSLSACSILCLIHFLSPVRRVATCKPGKPGLTSFSETLALFFIKFLSSRKIKVQDRQNVPSGLPEKIGWLRACQWSRHPQHLPRCLCLHVALACVFKAEGWSPHSSTA